VTRVSKRLGIYVDGPYGLVDTPSGPRVAPDPADLPFLTFACEVGRAFDATLLFARARPLAEGGRALLPEHVGVVALPPYDDLSRLGQVARGSVGTMRGFWRGLGRVDVVWVFGPHPFAFLLAGLAMLRRRRVVLGVRQDSVAYFRSRMPEGHGAAALLAVRALDAGYRALARAVPATVVGPEVARAYGGERPALFAMTVSLARDADLAERPPERDWSGPIRMLTVGRIDREKNPMLLLDAMAALERAHPGRFELDWAGTGPLEPAVRARAAELGLGERIRFLGFVPYESLRRRYAEAHLFVHVSLTEGVPAVILEALAAGTPVVATDVGGVRAAVGGGAAGLLVPPADVDALVAAVLRASGDGELRGRMAARGLELARAGTVDAQAPRIARFLAG
jgi:glycosyltransferase involved in cell wall biosynthesis